ASAESAASEQASGLRSVPSPTSALARQQARRPQSAKPSSTQEPPIQRALSSTDGGKREAASGGRSQSSSSRALPKSSSRGEGSKALTSEQVLREIKAQWQELVLPGKMATTRHGYVKRERVTELAIYGRGMDALDKLEYQSVVTSLQFHYVTIEVLLQDMGRLLKFRELSSLTLFRNQIQQPAQLLPLSMLPRLRSLSVEENPVCEGRRNLRVSLLRLLPGLREINGSKVEDSERVFASQLRAGELASKEKSAAPDVRQDGNMGDFASMVGSLISHACSVDEKISAVHDHFEDAVRAAIREAWDDVLALEGAAPADQSAFQQLIPAAVPEPPK
ncbi:unnamed protein product, partial [Polarella glacialis]